MSHHRLGNELTDQPKARQTHESKLGEGRGPYGIECHQHLFAAWAAGRAASVKGCRFRVEQGRAVLEASGFTPAFARPEQLPVPREVHSWHRDKRTQVVAAATDLDLKVTHGVAAKLINVYLKVRFVCGGYHDHKRVCALHPPIDDELLKALASANVGGCGQDWRKARRLRWSKFTSDDYELVIDLIRRCLRGRPLWMIEEHWKGNQSAK